MQIRIDPLSLVDRLAAWWLNWRTERAFKGTPAWEETKLARLEAEANGTMQAILESPSVVIMAQEAAALLDATNAENFFTFDMWPRLDRAIDPIRVTVEWVARNGPVKQLDQAKRALQLQEAVNEQLRAQLAALTPAVSLTEADLLAEEENAGALA